MLLVAFLVLGGVVGFAAGLLGIGGGMALAPILALLFAHQHMPAEVSVHAAIATSMATILFTSVSSLMAHQAKGNVIWPIVFTMAPGLIAGGLLVGGGLFALIDAGWLALFFAIFVAYNAVRMLTRKPPVAGTGALPGPVGLFAVGAGIGGLSGMVGAGGAFLSVPFMVKKHVPIHRAIGTSAALGFPIALASCVGYIYSGWGLATTFPHMVGYIYWPALLAIVCTSMLTAPMGARLSSRLPVATIKKIFAFILFLLAASMAWEAAKAFGLIAR